jgi:hypothetical protein
MALSYTLSKSPFIIIQPFFILHYLTSTVDTKSLNKHKTIHIVPKFPSGLFPWGYPIRYSYTYLISYRVLHIHPITASLI